nr:MAG TPA: hypothetical protein [Caudoviricetes sp.]
MDPSPVKVRGPVQSNPPLYLTTNKLGEYPANHLSGPLPRKGSGSGAEQPAIVFDHILIVLTSSSCLNV